MPDEKREGEDLFEDLDKFFAPIRDVDWESDEPSPPPREPAGEESVVVRPTEPPASEVAIDEQEEEQGEDQEQHEAAAAWYDTGVLETVDESASEEEPAGEDLEEVDHPVVIDEVETVPDPNQAPLFAGSSEGSTPEDAGEDDRGGPPPAAIDEEVEAEVSFTDTYQPSEEEIEAAAEHFASSVREGETAFDDTVAPLDEGAAVGDEHEHLPYAEVPVEGGDLMSDLGAADVEQDILSDLDEEQATRTVVVGAEGLGGPSWQEPTSVEVGSDVDRRGPDLGERDVPAAFLTGIVLAGVALGSLLIGPGAFAIVAAAVVLVAQGELFGVMVKGHRQPATAIGLATGALMMAGAYYRGEGGLLSMFALGLVATFLWFMAVPAAHRKDTLQNIGLTTLNVAYVPLLAGYLIMTLGLGDTESDGKALVVTVIGLAFIYDTAAFLVGSVWGGSFFQRPLAPATSPKKSIEGLIGATLITIIVSMALVPSFVGPFEDRRIESLLLAIVVAVAATLGDLAESLIKRDLGIKDMGSILPGHGGVLDRIDSLLFVAPASFLLFRAIFA